MSQSQRSSLYSARPTLLRLFKPQSQRPGSARWRINGHPVRLLIWSSDEWERLEERPADAQLHPHGVWCALRVE